MHRSDFALTQWRLAGPRRREAPLVLLLGVTALLALAAALLGSPVAGGGVLNALRAAGLTGTPPAGASGFQKLIDTLTQNAVWIIVTGIGLVLTIVGGMMSFGSPRAPDVMFRVIAGISVIMIGIPGLLA